MPASASHRSLCEIARASARKNTAFLSAKATLRFPGQSPHSLRAKKASRKSERLIFRTALQKGNDYFCSTAGETPAGALSAEDAADAPLIGSIVAVIILPSIRAACAT